MSRRKQNITYVKPEEPAFLKRIKQQVGYKDGPNIDTKREMPTFDDVDDDNEREDEKPQVVVLKPGDLDSEEMERITKEKADEEEKEKIAEGKVTFIKSAKRRASNGDRETSSTVATTKKTRTANDAVPQKPIVISKGVSESRLLSFDVPDEGE